MATDEFVATEAVEQFHDAEDVDLNDGQEPDLEASLHEVMNLLTKALNNRFQEAIVTCQRW